MATDTGDARIQRVDQANAATTDFDFDLANINGTNYLDVNKYSVLWIKVVAMFLMGTDFSREIHVRNCCVTMRANDDTTFLDETDFNSAAGLVFESARAGAGKIAPSTLTLSLSGTNLRVRKNGSAGVGNIRGRVRIEIDALRET